MKSWYNVISASKETEIQILDEIGGFGISYNDFIEDVSGVDNDIKLVLNTPGGSTFEGLAIYDSLSEHKQKGHKVSVKIVGTAASMGAVLVASATSPKDVEIAEHSRLMIHRAIGGGIGTAEEVESAANLIKSEENKIVKILANFSQKKETEIRDAMNNTTWYHGEDIIKNGFAGKLINIDKIKNTWDESKMSIKYNYKIDIMNKEFKEINTVLKVEGLVIDEEKGTYLQKGQIEAINKALTVDHTEAVATAVNDLQETHDTAIGEKQTEIDNLATEAGVKAGEHETAITDSEAKLTALQTKFNTLESTHNKLKAKGMNLNTGEPNLQGQSLTDREKQHRQNAAEMVKQSAKFEGTQIGNKPKKNKKADQKDD